MGCMAISAWQYLRGNICVAKAACQNLRAKICVALSAQLGLSQRTRTSNVLIKNGSNCPTLQLAKAANHTPCPVLPLVAVNEHGVVSFVQNEGEGEGNTLRRNVHKRFLVPRLRARAREEFCSDVQTRVPVAPTAKCAPGIRAHTHTHTHTRSDQILDVPGRRLKETRKCRD